MSTSTQPESIPAAHPSRGIEWQYEPSEEEFIEAKALPGGLEDDALVGPIGAKAIASVTGAVSTALLMTPFDVLKTRLQTVRPSQTIMPNATPSPMDTVCCQTAVLPKSDGSAQSGPGPSSMRQRISPTSFSPLNAANATCLSANIAPQTSNGASFIPPMSASSTRLGLQGGSVQASSTALAPPVPEGCLHPSKWAGIWGEILTQEEAERMRRSSSSSAGKGISALGKQAKAGVKQLGKKIAGVGVEGGFWNEIKVIMAEPAGWRGLWKGVGTGLGMSVPSASIYMLGYEYLLATLNGRIPGSLSSASDAKMSSFAIIPQHTTLQPSTEASNLTSESSVRRQAYLSPVPFIAGSLARSVSATVISPMELFRTRLQALPAPGEPAPTYASTLSSITRMVKEQGPRALWRGLGPTLWRDVPFSGLYWVGFESIKRFFTESQIVQPGITMTFTSGALSGTLASLVTQPFDVLKTRRQVFTPSSSCSPAALAHPASTIPLLQHIIKTEGWKALFAGVIPRTAKVAPACGMMIAAYEGVGHLLGGRAADRNA